MEFMIYATSGEIGNFNWQKLKKEFKIKQKEEKDINWWGDEYNFTIYFIEINSIEELVKLCEYEDIIVHKKGSKDSRFYNYKDYYSIEIYDDRE